MKTTFSILALSLIFQISFAQDPPKNDAKKEPEVKAEETNGLKLPIKPTKKIEFTTDEGTWMALDVSPDGSTIVFELLGDLYTVPMTGGEAKLLVGDASYDGMPKFSPDGKKVLFVSDRSGSDNLWTVGIDGKGYKAITQGRNTSYLSPFWAKDGNTVFASKGPGFGVYKLQMIDLRGGVGTQIGGGGPRANRMGVCVSPDGRYVYYAERQGAWDYNAGFPMWAINRFDRKLGTTVVVSAAQGSSMHPVLSPDGTQMVYATRDRLNTGLRIRDLATGEERWLAYPIDRDDQESRATRDTIPGYTFTPDGKYIVLNVQGKLQKIAVETGKNEVIPFTAKVSKMINEPVYFEHSLPDSPKVKARIIRDANVSPDGKQVVFRALGKIYIQDLDGKSAPQRVSREDLGAEFTPNWSPDGRSIVFATWSDAKGGTLHVFDAVNRVLRKLSSKPGVYSNPIFTPDGQTVYFIQTTRAAVLDAALGSHKAETLLHEPSEIGGSPERQNVEIRSISINGGESTAVPILGYNLQFCKGNDRLYYQLGGNLFSARYDGFDQRLVANFTGTSGDRGQQNEADAVLISPDASQALIAVEGRLHIVDLPMTGAPLMLNVAGGLFPVKSITADGNDAPQWAAGGKQVVWSQGNKLYRQVLAEEKPTIFECNVEKDRAVPQGKVLLTGARLITMKGDTVVPKGDILVINNKIAAVGPTGTFEVPQGTKRIDISGKTVSPGYVDVHSHWFGNSPFGYPQSWGYLANLAYGVTTNRDPQSGSTDIYDFADAVDAGEAIGPRQLTTGPGVFAGSGIESNENVRTYIKRYTEQYNTWYIKQYVSGDRMTRQQVAMACKEFGLTPTTEGALEVKMAMTEMMDGYTGHEHALPQMPLYKDMAQFMAQAKVFYTPTLVVTYGGPFGEDYYFTTENPTADPKVQRFVPRKLLDGLARRKRNWNLPEEYAFSKVAESCNRVVKAGGKVCLGSHGEFQGMGAHWEIWSLASGGMSPLNVLKCATIFGAEALGLHKQLGSIEPGKYADLIIYDKNPLDNIRNTASIRFVMKNGELYDGNTMDVIYPVAKKLPKFYWETPEIPVTIK